MRDFSAATGDQTTQELTFEEVAKAAASSGLDVCRYLFPEGQIRGPEFVIGDLRGGRGESLSINHQTGVWTDFADTSQGGADLISLWAAVSEVSQREAKQEIEEWLGMSSGDAPVRHQAAPARQQTPQEERKPEWWEGRAPTTKWTYARANGTIFAQVWRWDDPAHGKHIQPAGKVPNEPRPLLYIQDITSRPGEPVIVTEGEKACDAVREVGALATCSMNGSKSPAKTDWSPCRGREVVIWPDNDPAGAAYADTVTRLCLEAGAASIRRIQPPKDAAPGDDAADIEPDSRNIVIAEAIQSDPSEKAADYGAWGIERFEGEPPERKFLIADTIPLGVAGLMAAMGDTGKGMMLLDLALKVAAGEPTAPGKQNFAPPLAFGREVIEFGSAVIMSAEDDFAELHRRLNALDPDGRKRLRAKGRLWPVPLPDEGGVRPFFVAYREGVEPTEHYARFRDWLATVPDLKLVVIDPIVTFVHADINTDSVPAAFVMSKLAQLAANTGASVIVAHHMSKGDRSKPIQSASDARHAIRGTTALVDGVRLAYAVWPVAEGKSARVCKELGQELRPNLVFEGAVVKSNGPADRTVRTYVRSQKTGLLEDRTTALLMVGAEAGDLSGQLLEAIADKAFQGHPFTKTGLAGLHERKAELHSALRDVGRTKLWEMLEILLEAGHVLRCRYRRGKPQWLDVPGGQFAAGLGEFSEGAPGAPVDDNFKDV